MKKFLKSCLVVVLAVCVALPLVACKKKVSPTTADVTNVKAVNGVDTNGGMTVVYGEYLYFINGVKTNDGTSQKGNTRSAICRVKYDTATGETSGDVEVVIDELVGFEDGSINIFGDYLYYATPCADKNSSADVLYNKTTFKRYDLVNKKSYTLYTTAENSSSATVKYAYYVSGETLNLLVYESGSDEQTIKSLRIDKDVKENYTISDVTSCLFSENYGKVTTSGASVDANSFVYYTKDTAKFEAIQTGNKVYKTSPVTDNSVELLFDGNEIELVSVRAGKLIYSCNEVVYAQLITDKNDEKLLVNPSYAICHGGADNAIYLENYKYVDSKFESVNGEIAVITFDETGKQFNIVQWSTSDTNHIIGFKELTTITGDVKDFSMIGTVVLEEVTSEEDAETEVKEKFLYVIYKNNSIIYKVKVAKLNSDGSMSVELYKSSVQLSTSTLSDTTGILTPEIIGNFLFIMGEDDDENDYMLKVDLTVKEKPSKESDFIYLEEPVEETEEDDEE